ncbi:MAG: hypothetical protein QMD85_02640 [Candidatus Aenigmarchaeota archaeon]|nr:hypothetical protein [Candidatus Aenigmarchaeota archaeon]MDI6722444.1 hypothetical protein [Candidatus Aenigmarchaeota archaeon]
MQEDIDEKTYEHFMRNHASRYVKSEIRDVMYENGEYSGICLKEFNGSRHILTIYAAQSAYTHEAFDKDGNLIECFSQMQ